MMGEQRLTAARLGSLELQSDKLSREMKRGVLAAKGEATSRGCHTTMRPPYFTEVVRPLPASPGHDSVNISFSPFL